MGDLEVRNEEVPDRCSVALLLVPAPARADWLFSATPGVTFGGDAKDREHFTYGVSLGWMGAGIVGWEADLSFTPEFFEQKDGAFDLDGGSNVVTAMGNVLVGIPIGGARGAGLRPYITGGLGLLQKEARSTRSAFDIDNNEFGFNIGAGAFGFFNDHVGIRGDLRYFRSFEDPREDNEFDIGVGNFNYWRGTGGLTFRW